MDTGGVFFGGTQLPSVLPDTWELTTATGEVIEAASDPPRANFVDAEPMVGVPDSIRFEVESEEDLREVTAVAVTGWRVAVPAETIVEMTGAGGATAQLHDGTVIVLDTILEQRTGTIVDFDLERPADPWRVAVDQGFGTSTEFVGAGPGWLRASSTIGGLGLQGGITGFQLVWSEATAPEVVRILARVQVRAEEDVEAVDARRRPETPMQFRHDDASAVPPGEQAKGPDQPYVRSGRKVGRNEPCPCGSGKKFKQCHGRLQ